MLTDIELLLVLQHGEERHVHNVRPRLDMSSPFQAEFAAKYDAIMAEQSAKQITAL